MYTDTMQAIEMAALVIWLALLAGVVGLAVVIRLRTKSTSSLAAAGGPGDCDARNVRSRWLARAGTVAVGLVLLVAVFAAALWSELRAERLREERIFHQVVREILIEFPWEEFEWPKPAGQTGGETGGSNE